MSDSIECPWCYNQVVIEQSRCPVCKHEVIEEHLNESFDEGEEPPTDLTINEMIASRFICSRCKHDECNVKEVAMTGTGLSKLLDIQYNHYLFVSCLNCGFVEIYDPDVLNGKTAGKLGTILDVLFGA